MRKAVALGIVSMIVLSASFVLAQSPRGKAGAEIGDATVEIDYGRPSLNGREMLSRAPVGFVWRLGADQSTTFTTSADLIFGNVTVAAGSYSLFAKRTGENSWELVFNEQTGQWGTEYNASRDVVSVPLQWAKQDASTEVFTIEVAPTGSGGEFRATWGENILSAEFGS